MRPLRFKARVARVTGRMTMPGRSLARTWRVSPGGKTQNERRRISPRAKAIYPPPRPSSPVPRPSPPTGPPIPDPESRPSAAVCRFGSSLPLRPSACPPLAGPSSLFPVPGSRFFPCLLPLQMTNAEGPMKVILHSARSALVTPLPALVYKNRCPQVSGFPPPCSYSVSFDTVKSYAQRSMAIH